ncbi:endonuclease/exonuclease/phosphatase family protein [Flavicella sp.]|uniref:endonuclease/exonuclease/phosphatase family protein n=1 Tax=Flavicella sp. TaxID=2957742 RepID=UPI003019DE86
MTKYALILLVIVTFFSCTEDKKEKVIETFMTYNIRYDNKEDGINRWNLRKKDLVSVIKKHNPAILGVQEALYNQIEYLKNNTVYNYIGRGRDDGEKEGEYSAIFFDPNKVELVEDGMFWLSENIDTPNIGWDAVCKRVVTWGKFILNHQELYFFNTHFDHVGKIARIASSDLLLQKIEEIAGNKAVIICGDFNFNDRHKGYENLTDTIQEYFLRDSFKTTDNEKETNTDTFRGFSISNPIKNENRIDYIFYKNGVIVLDYKIDSSNNGTSYFSDHLPVIIKSEIRNK